MIAIALFLLIPVLILLFAFVFTVSEENFGLLYNKPFYVHFYPNKKSLTANQAFILKNQFVFYTTLSDKKKKYFEHRVATFINHFQFIGKNNFVITDEVKVLIAATSVMLTFGMRNYLYKVIDKIIVYPTQYYSTVSDANHKGEFNPRMRAIVFSWDDFLSGFEISNDNFNLGIHEFAHVLHFHGLKSDDASAIIFSRIYTQIQKELINSNYFRIYAYTNHFEFLAVIMEHYFETPQLFQEEFPQLFKKVSIMLNHTH
jgi:Mlc titration factor MtfA (ptsG expression regulator)